MILAFFLLFASAPQADVPVNTPEHKTASAALPGDASAPRRERERESKPESEPAETQPAAPAGEVSFLPGQLTLHALIRNAEEPNSSTRREGQPAEPPAPPISAALRRSAESPSAAQRRTWCALAIASHSAATFDAWSTRRAISRGYGREMNPTLQPFANSGGLYAAIQASPLLLDYLGRRMMTSQHRFLRKMWWLPQSAGATVSFASGVHNVRLGP